MAGAAGDVGPIGVTEVHTAANAVAIPTIRVVAVDLATLTTGHENLQWGGGIGLHR